MKPTLNRAELERQRTVLRAELVTQRQVMERELLRTLPFDGNTPRSQTMRFLMTHMALTRTLTQSLRLLLVARLIKPK